MKKYMNPEMEEIKFDIIDVIQSSSGGDIIDGGSTGDMGDGDGDWVATNYLNN